jgi:chromosome partitioning protein
MKTIAIYNNKGGVGKTSVTQNLAECLTRREGKPVLLVDLDAQGNLSTCFETCEEKENGTYDFIYKKTALKDCVTTISDKLDILTGSNVLNDVCYELKFKNRIDNMLKRNAKDLKKYDFVLFDCPPAFNVLTKNAFYCADHILIVANADGFCIDAINEIQNFWEESLKSGSKADFAGIILNKYNAWERVQRKTFKMLKDGFGDIVFENTIRKCVDITTTQFDSQSIFDLKKSAAQSDFVALTKEFLAKIDK